MKKIISREINEHWKFSGVKIPNNELFLQIICIVTFSRELKKYINSISKQQSPAWYSRVRDIEFKQ
jgi:hypothetical protein